MMITIWVFVGIEGAVAISGRAKKERDVGKATIIAFICVLSIYLMVSVLSMGVMPLSELAQLGEPGACGRHGARGGAVGRHPHQRRRGAVAGGRHVGLHRAVQRVALRGG